MADYPVSFDIHQPEKYDHAHVVIRILILILMGALAGAIGWAPGLLYLAIPVLAAVLISQKGGSAYLAEAENGITGWLRIILAFYSYLALLTDRLPNDKISEFMQFEVKPGGTPTTGNALLRIILALPSAIVLLLLWIVGLVLALIAGVMILFQETYPAGIYDFLRGLMRWEARLFAYLASLVEEYPPFALDTGAESAASGPSAPEQGA
jgi:hypothetical protein